MGSRFRQSRRPGPRRAACVGLGLAALGLVLGASVGGAQQRPDTVDRAERRVERRHAARGTAHRATARRAGLAGDTAGDTAERFVARRPVTVRSVPIENLSGLARFHDAVRSLRAGERVRVRVLHYGDSNVASDLWTAVTRQRLQDAFGDGGPGYLVPPPWGSRYGGPVRIAGGRNWEGRRHGFARDFGPNDGLWGLAGVAVEGLGAQARLTVEVPPLARGGVLELHALGRPTGGTVGVKVDGTAVQDIDTARPSHGLIRERVNLGPGAHRVEIRVTSWRPVRLLGIVLERDEPGVVYDVLGINGHRVAAHLHWNRDLLQSQLAARSPDLVVLSYGGNEALDPRLNLQRYEEHLSQALGQVRDLAPDASCLVVAPVAMCPENPRNAAVTRVQRRIAPRFGCGFWNTSEVSGGPGSLCEWIRSGRGLVSGDRLHLAQAGYRLVGQKFTDALMRDL